MKRALALVALTLVTAACTAAPSGTPVASQPAAAPAAAASPSPQPSATPAPSPTPAPTADCRAQPGIIESQSVPSERLGEPLLVNVYVPACPPPADGYPALYLLHGQVRDAEQWPGFGLAAQMDGLIAAGGRSFLVVMPYEADYMAEPAENEFADVVASELLPWIDENYPTCTRRACRAVGGLSRGAAWAVRLGFSRPALFAAVGAHSLPVFYGDMNRLPTWLAEMPAGEPPRLYLDIGADDRYLAPAAEFQALLVHLRLQHEWHLNAGGHEDVYWTEHLPEYLEWYGSVLGE